MQIPAIRAAAVLFVVVFILWDQAWRPDAAREREVLAGQLAEAVERMDRLQEERRAVAYQRGQVAAGNLSPDRAKRWTGEPYQSTEHAVFDYDRRLRHLDEDIATIVKQAKRYSEGLESIDSNGGRRVPITSRLLSMLRREFGK